MKLSGNTILITGGGGGIGLALAQRFVELGNEVIICGRRESKLMEAQRQVPGLHIKKCDVALDGDRKDLFSWVTQKFPQLNVLINNAAIQGDSDLTKGMDGLNNLSSEIAVNYEAPILLGAMFLDHLKKQKDPVIINVTSSLGLTPVKHIPIYCSLKAGLHIYTLILRQQLKELNIEVFDVLPPKVDTDLNLEGRTKRNERAKAPGLSSLEYADSVIKDLGNDQHEILYGELKEQFATLPSAELEMLRLDRYFL